MKNKFFMAACGVFLSACSSTPDPTLLDLTMTADADLNPDLTSRPSPMVVKLVELKSHTAFGNADYFALAGNTKNTLGPDYVAEEVLPVRPGESKTLKLCLHPGSRFIGVIAEYRALDKAVWRYVIQPEKEDFSAIRLALTRDAIRPLTPAQYEDKQDSTTALNVSQIEQKATGDALNSAVNLQ